MIRMGETSASGEKKRGDPGQENILPVGSEEVGVSWGECVSVFGREDFRPESVGRFGGIQGVIQVGISRFRTYVLLHASPFTSMTL